MVKTRHFELSFVVESGENPISDEALEELVTDVGHAAEVQLEMSAERGIIDTNYIIRKRRATNGKDS